MMSGAGVGVSVGLGVSDGTGVLVAVGGVVGVYVGVMVGVLVAAAAVSAADVAASSSGEGPQADNKMQNSSRAINKSILLYLNITCLLFVFCESGETSNKYING